MPAPAAARGRGRVLAVVGGGPAGMEAARVAAERGHRVQLFEAGERLGGRLDLAARTARRVGWRPYLDWLERELVRLGVAIECGVRAGVDEVLATRPNRVVVATGSIPAGSTAPAGVVELDEFVAESRTDERVVLADLGAAGMELWSAALEAAYRGAREVTVVTQLSTIGADLDGPTLFWLREEFARLGVRALTEHTVCEMGPSCLTAQELYSGDRTRVHSSVIVASAPRQSYGGELVAALTGRVPLTIVGDALVPRDASAAIREGQEAALELDVDPPPAIQLATRFRS